MDPAAIAAKIKEYLNLIVGVKTAPYNHREFAALKRAVEAARFSGTPVMPDSSILTNCGRTMREKLLDVMRPGSGFRRRVRQSGGCAGRSGSASQRR
jgi:hypothetical protein